MHIWSKHDKYDTKNFEINEEMEKSRKINKTFLQSWEWIS